MLEDNLTYVNRNPMCEPQLGRRGLYSSMGGAGESRGQEMALLWVLNLSDGAHSLLDIAERSGLSFESISQAAALLMQNGLLEETPRATTTSTTSHEETGAYAMVTDTRTTGRTEAITTVAERSAGARA